MDTMYSASAQLIRGVEANVHPASTRPAPAPAAADRPGPVRLDTPGRAAAGGREHAPRRSARRRALASAAAACSVGAALLLSGCGQNFEQEGGVVPVPHASTEGVRTVTPAPAPSEPVIGPGYAPPRGERPTQTAVPNLPGGKL